MPFPKTPLSISLTTCPKPEAVQEVIQAALEAADPYQAVRKVLYRDSYQLTIGNSRYSLEDFQNIYLLAAGKASIGMARAVIELLGDRIPESLIITKNLPNELPGYFDTSMIIQGNHPVPGTGSVEAAVKAVRLLSQAGQDDLVICAISGGGSALMTLPYPGIELSDLQAMTNLLLDCGANIQEINIVRKHIDHVKGGGLARAAAPARVASLILSDVVGNPLDMIASGPTVPDPSTFQDAFEVFEKYQIQNQIPAAIMQVLEDGRQGKIPETLKPGDPVFTRVENIMVGSNLQSAEAGLRQAEAEGFKGYLLTTSLQGEAQKAGAWLTEVARSVDDSGSPVSRPACLVAGGETIVSLTGNGKGGRNQEVALGAVEGLAGIEDILLVTLATDGEDGPTEAAGAVVNGQTAKRAEDQNLDPEEYLANNDAFHFFEALGDLFITGPTGTNVNDLNFLFLF